MPNPVITRFAPSPTGALHLGNARTALFNWLYARRHGGRFVLRIEDTDEARNAGTGAVDALLADLGWLGLGWDAGPDRDDLAGPYRQSERGPRYAEAFRQLEAADAAYPCYCSTLELELARKRAQSAGLPPRYPGTCAALGAAERAARAAEGRAAALRFRMPAGTTLAWSDLVRGPQSFAADELGDFVIRRADGSPAFLFANVVDDAAMGITHVLRGEDHVANTPRQRALARALGSVPPEYGHLPLLVGPAGAPLSKRDGALGLAALRAEGFLPGAVQNLLARLGHHYEEQGFLAAEELARGFDLASLGRAPAHVDREQLLHWQREAVHRAPMGVFEDWVRERVPAASLAAFASAIAGNVVLPAQAREWAGIVYGEIPAPAGALADLLRAPGAAFYDAALAAPPEYPGLVAALKRASGLGGAALFKPLRVALTGREEGPELAKLLALLPRAAVLARLARARALALDS